MYPLLIVSITISNIFFIIIPKVFIEKNNIGLVGLLRQWIMEKMC